jgi:alanyl-tRNA synthetase
MKTDVLRDKFLEFFKSKKHKIVESDSLVPKDDPTVLFTPAGMNQFKKQFLGLITDFRRAASSQRCLRTDDLDKVGKSDYHHTFFEMLGNFSFGDYFKEEAIAWAWEFLTRELKISPEKLWVSVYKDDDQAFNIWKDKIKVPLNKILKLGDRENFWPSSAKEKGPNGPCGPCSEIFFDQGIDKGCKEPNCSPVCDCGRFIEVWNLVFTQFNRKDGAILEPLPQKNIDTGMGLERLAAVMQEVSNNFETDLFKPLLNQIAAGCKPQAAAKNKELLYALADHLRAIVFSIYDGVLPSNEARGYVVRKLIRKSVLHLRQLGINAAFLYKIVPLLADIMKSPYPELIKRRENISDIILAEEKNFINTLDSSHSLLEEKLKSGLSPDKAGAIAFLLYDTYGIPPELTINWAKKQGIEISKEAFDRELDAQKLRSKSGSAMQGDVFSAQETQLKDIPETKFLGYEKNITSAKISKILKDNQEVQTITEGEVAKIVLGQSVFYAESGGQIADTGIIEDNQNVFEVSDTKSINKVILHIGKVRSGSFKKGDSVQAKIELRRRMAIARNHTATHLLQAALRKVLGLHVKQQGSLVAEDRLRFDFTHFKDIKKEELDRTEEVVNEFIIQNHPVEKKEMTLSQAKECGALAFFAEKYEDNVRVVSAGDISQELCAGTHLDNTGLIGLFKIIHEGSVASGIRRIEAVTGFGAYKMIKEEENILAEVSEILNTAQEKIAQELKKRLKQMKELEKQVSLQRLNSVKSGLDELIQKGAEINGIKVIAERIDNADMDLLRKTADLLKEKELKVVAALGSDVASRVWLVTVTNLADFDVSALIKEIAFEIGGSGGGRKDFAQAGGNKPENLSKALDKFKKLVHNLIEAQSTARSQAPEA